MKLKCTCNSCLLCYKRNWAREDRKKHPGRYVKNTLRYHKTEKGKAAKKRSDKKWKAKNRDHINEKRRERYHRDIEDSRLKGRIYNYRRRGSGGARDIVNSIALDYCKLCGAKDNLTLDHMHPVSLGGKTTKENLQALCKSCNSFKSNKLMTPGGAILIGG